MLSPALYYNCKSQAEELAAADPAHLFPLVSLVLLPNLQPLIVFLPTAELASYLGFARLN